ncbi:MAG TPA: 1-acyl-sn-glycerol-3-phosphate acyltransferase [Acidimicrobiales bacterium]|nr:1-acyl-sn-glycerol-3-phosphate acyltransferase [Acidimicrobiales bacterium]
MPRRRERPPVSRRTVDRVLAWLALVLLLGFYRRVEVHPRRPDLDGRPVLIVSNHFNGFVDPVMLVRVLGRVPRFLAKSTLWNVVVARPFLALAGVIPVYRAVDVGTGTAANASTFTACHEVLAERGVVAIFPEGTTHDRPQLAPVRTGAARIALGAKAAGVEGLVILPVGLTFDDKIALRSRALARIGEPIDLDARIGDFVADGEEVDEDNHAAGDRLTDEIAARLSEASPVFADVREQQGLRLAAEIALRRRDTGWETTVPLGEREVLAQRLAAAPDGRRAELLRAVADYNLDLTGVGVRDGELVAGYRVASLVRHLVWSALLVGLVVALSVVGAAVNLIPFAIVRVASRRVSAPVTKGTVRLLVSLVAFPLTWWVFAMVVADGWEAVSLTFVLTALDGLLAVFAFEAVARLLRDYRSWRSVTERRGMLDEARARREETVALVEAVAIEATPDAGALPAPPPTG